jgi:hypothetical protein
LNQFYRARKAAHVSCQEVINAMDHRAQMVLVLYKRLIIFWPAYLTVRCDQIGKPIGCGRNIGCLVRREPQWKVRVANTPHID